MIRVSSSNEWGTIREVVVGRAEYSRIPKDSSFHWVNFAGSGVIERFPDSAISEASEDLENLADVLFKIGAIVHRPSVCSYGAYTPKWETESSGNYSARDVLLVYRDTVIETPSPVRSRYYEAESYRDIFLNSDGNLIAAPKPRLLFTDYLPVDPEKPVINSKEPCFDAANILRLGDSLLYQISNTGNPQGAEWLKRTLGVAVDTCYLYSYAHIDTTIIPLDEGLVLFNSDRVPKGKEPECFLSWEKVWFDDVVDIGCVTSTPMSSKYIGLNLLVSGNYVIVEKSQLPLIRLLESFKFDVIPVQMRHARLLGGGPHCVTLDLCRD